MINAVYEVTLYFKNANLMLQTWENCDGWTATQDMIRNVIIRENWGSHIVGKMVESHLRNENMYRSTFEESRSDRW